MDPIHPIIPNDPRLPILPARPTEAVKREQRRHDDEGDDGRRDDEHAEDERGPGRAASDDPNQATVVDLEAADDEPSSSEEWGVYDDHGAYELRVSGGQFHRAGPPSDPPADASGPDEDAGAREATPPRADAPDSSAPAPESGEDSDPGWHIDISA